MLSYLISVFFQGLVQGLIQLNSIYTDGRINSKKIITHKINAHDKNCEEVKEN